MMSVQILGGLWVFAPWIGSSENPSDWPSSWFGLRAGDLPPAGAFLSLRERGELRGRIPRFELPGVMEAFLPLCCSAGAAVATRSKLLC